MLGRAIRGLRWASGGNARSSVHGRVKVGIGAVEYWFTRYGS